ncbi:hypothetical protein [Nonomuraea sp. B5E05]
MTTARELRRLRRTVGDYAREACMHDDAEGGWLRVRLHLAMGF